MKNSQGNELSFWRSKLLSVMRRLSPFWKHDKSYLSVIFYLQMKNRLHWKNPMTFNEKLQWLKLYDRKPIYPRLVDKAAVKDYVADRIGKEYVIKTIGIYDTPQKIDFNKLPDKFVLKTTHGGGGNGVVVCKDKNTLDVPKVRGKLKKSLESDIYTLFREWPYKDVPRKIIAEEYVESEDGDLRDYKFFCFNGEPRFLKVDFGRFVEHHANYYDMEWNLMPFEETDVRRVAEHREIQPGNFKKMVEFARKLSQGHKFLRVDLYNVNGKIYFGELTFYPVSGLGTFTPSEWDRKLGAMMSLESE